MALASDLSSLQTPAALMSFRISISSVTKGTVQSCQTLGFARRTSHAGITTHSVNAVPDSPMVVAMGTRTTLRRNSSVLSPAVASPRRMCLVFGGKAPFPL